MPTFVFAYRSPTGYAPSPESVADWMAWFDGMGDHLVDHGKPAVSRAAIGNCSPDKTELGGYSLIHADDLEKATVIAKGCPQLNRGGGVEIGELGEVPDPSLLSRSA
jgi:hypothetical protein